MSPMSEQALLIELRLLGGRYHGVGDWPPSPFRLFQALVAGAYGGRWRSEPREPKDAAFRWLERLSPPYVVAPACIQGRAATHYVPNNDADTIGGDPLRVSEIRVSKRVQPMLLADDASILYAWRFVAPDARDGDAGLAPAEISTAGSSVGPNVGADADADANALRLCDLAERLHTCGRGIDAAYASAQIAGWEAIETRLRRSGSIARPSSTDATTLSVTPGDASSRNVTSDAVRCPTAGSFDSLERRHQAMSRRLDTRPHGRSVVTLFRQPPKVRCRVVAYECPPTRLLFDLRRSNNSRPFSPVPQRRAVDVATSVRDLVVRRLVSAVDETIPVDVTVGVTATTTADVLAKRTAEIESALVGRRLQPVDASRRVRFVPLPSIGARHTDPSIRRVMIEIPPGCMVSDADMSWAVSGQRLPAFDKVDDTTGESSHTVLVPTDDTRMLARYGIGTSGFKRWHTVTPAALPVHGPRGGATGSARVNAENQRCRNVIDALRHAGLDPRGVRVRVQREPFLQKGLRAEMSAAGRFDRSRLHHVEVTFPRPISGPVILGDGRWFGLGIMAPIAETPDSLYVFAVAPRRWRVADGPALARALRRAVMARAGQNAPGRQLTTFFSGHEDDGRPAEARHHQHLFYLADDVDGDGFVDRLAIVAPHLADPSSPPDRRSLVQLSRAIAGLEQVRAGALGVVDLGRTTLDDGSDPLFGTGRVWMSRTAYRPTRHPKRNANIGEWLSDDITRECLRRGLPQPTVRVIKSAVGPRGGLLARFQITFARTITGPVMLGTESHFGAGAFAVER